ASEVPCGAAPTKWRFLQRNRLIAAAGLATVVVEAGRRSGTLNTAGHAADLGRPLGAVPGPVSSAASAGCHRLFREFDAVCVTSAAEVRELWAEAAPESQSAPAADPHRVRLLDALSTRAPRDVLELARRSGMDEGRVRSILGVMDLEGGAARREAGWIRTA
ncbi:MAG: DNA-processing protein DprA, partial [Microbacterium sp.]|nr:DNA-processing protein DprA [Microbacterium sp.]